MLSADKRWHQFCFQGPIPSARHNHAFHTVDEKWLISFGGWSRGISSKIWKNLI
jgi:hypothetical protein